MTRRTFHEAGFSLVEVSMAMALVAFCFVSLLYFLPSGLAGVEDATRSAEAMRLLKQMATGMQAATKDREAGLYKMVGVGDLSEIRWFADGNPMVPVRFWITASGIPVPNAGEADYVCRVSLTPPDKDNPASYGLAHWQIAWPARAAWEEEGWSNAHGHDELLLMFREP